MNKIKFAVIGCGKVAPTYLYVLQHNQNSEVVALIDSDETRLQQIRKEFRVGSTYRCYLNALSKESLDAVVICTPHYLHHDQAVVCAENGLDILCEKPLATNMQDLEEMIEKCKEIRFGVMLQRRFYPNSITTKKIIEEGLIGEVTKASLAFSCHKDSTFYQDWRGRAISGGGVLISQALHRIDQLTYFFGKPTSVKGITRKTRDYIEVEDYARGTVFFEDNVVVNIEANNSSGDPETRSTIGITGTKGNILLSDDKVVKWNVPDLERPGDLDINEIPTKYRPAYYGPAHEIVINDFVDSIIQDRQPTFRGEDSLNAMKIIFGFYESARKGGVVVDLR
ncbi:MAG: Gfo/Idh/MocA family oxidoreductase [Nanoarchaeota archaeon]